MKGGHGALEVAKTVIEVADVAWSAIECCHNHIPSHDSPEPTLTEEEQLHALRSENRRLRKLLEQNLHLLQNISESHCLLKDCPPDVFPPFPFFFKLLPLNFWQLSNFVLFPILGFYFLFNADEDVLLSLVNYKRPLV